MPEHLDPLRVCARRAEDLAPDVPYVRGWSDARRAAEALADRLRQAGLASDFPGLKADVNAFGDGIVCLGTVRPETVTLLARMLSTALCTELAEDGTGPAADTPAA